LQWSSYFWSGLAIIITKHHSVSPSKWCISG
jgi:hypothetical protein